MTKNQNFMIGIIISGLLTVVGVVCWVMQLSQGLQMTNLNNDMTWGLYVVLFVLFTGITAGSLIFTSSAYLFKGMEEYKPYTRISAFAGVIGGVVATGLFIVVDIGNPLRALNIITSPNVTSPLFWDTVILLVYVIAGIVLTRQLLMVQSGKKEEKSLQAVSWVSFIAGLLVMVTSSAFAMQVARPLWNNPVEPVSFLAAALAAALSVLIIIFTILNKTGYTQMSGEQLKKLGKLTGVFLLFELFVVLGEAGIGLYAGAGEEAEIIHWLVSGKGAPFFWVEMIAFVLGFILLANNNAKTSLTVTGAGVSLFAVFMIKYNLLQAQLLNPLIPNAGPLGHHNGVYLPSIIEIGVSVGIVAAACLLVLIGVNMLNLSAGKQAEAKVSYKGNTINS